MIQEKFNWKWRSIESLCINVTSGGTPSRSNPDFYKNGTIPWLKTKELKGYYIYDSEEKITKQGLAKSSAKLFPAETVLMAMYGDGRTITSLGILKSEAATNQACCAMIPDTNECDPKFLLYSLSANREHLLKLAIGGAQRNLSGKIIRDFKILAPPTNVQRKIAGILSAYDDLIENNLRRIKILEMMAQSLYREWFVHFRFPGHESVRHVDSDLGPIPKGWEVRTIEELVKRIPVGKKYDQKTANPTGTVPIFDQGKTGVIGYHDDQPGVEASETDPVIVFANHTCYQRLIHYPFSAIQNVLPFRPSPLLLRNIYWLHYATNGRLVLNDYKGHWPEFAALLVVVPPAAVCQRFGAFVALLSLEILKLEQAVDLLRRTRDLLLPKLLRSNSSNV
jgi:type I restriction enzyme, S subunit